MDQYFARGGKQTQMNDSEQVLVDALRSIIGRLTGIAREDLTKAEKQILNIAQEALADVRA